MSPPHIAPATSPHPSDFETALERQHATEVAPSLRARDPAVEPKAPAAAPADPAWSSARAERPVGRRTFSVGATFLGWAVAAFFGGILITAIAALLGLSAAEDGALTLGDAEGLSLVALFGYGIATLLAFVIGGYAAGRISLWDGMSHGMGTVAWAVIATILVALAAATLNTQVALPQTIPATIDGQALGTALAIWVAVFLVASLAGGAIGGRLGERYHEAMPRPRTRRFARGRAT